MLFPIIQPIIIILPDDDDGCWSLVFLLDSDWLLSFDFVWTDFSFGFDRTAARGRSSSSKLTTFLSLLFTTFLSLLFTTFLSLSFNIFEVSFKHWIADVRRRSSSLSLPTSMSSKRVVTSKSAKPEATTSGAVSGTCPLAESEGSFSFFDFFSLERRLARGWSSSLRSELSLPELSASTLCRWWIWRKH